MQAAAGQQLVKHAAAAAAAALRFLQLFTLDLPQLITRLRTFSYTNILTHLDGETEQRIYNDHRRVGSSSRSPSSKNRDSLLHWTENRKQRTLYNQIQHWRADERSKRNLMAFIKLDKATGM